MSWWPLRKALEVTPQTAFKRPSSIVVSSRVSALAAADEISVLDAGRIVERGTHAELVTKAGAHAEARFAQIDTEDEAEAVA